MNNAIGNNEKTRRAVVSLLLGIAAIVGGWWGVEAWIDRRIGAQVGPVARELDTVSQKVERTAALANQNNGILRAIAGRLLVEVPPQLPALSPQTEQ